MAKKVFTDEQINEIIEIVTRQTGHNKYIGARYVPIFGRKNEDSIEWDNSKPYEPLTIVLYQGNSFTSRQYVPAGVDINSQEFWANTGNYNAQIEQYRQEIETYKDEVQKIKDDYKIIESDIDEIALNYQKSYNTVNEMVSDTDIKAGMTVKTNGFYSVNDGGSALYTINENLSATDDNSIIACSNNLYAKIVETDNFNFKKHGGYEGTDTTRKYGSNSSIMQALIDLNFPTSNNEIHIPSGRYYFYDQININYRVRIVGDSSMKSQRGTGSVGTEIHFTKSNAALFNQNTEQGLNMSIAGIGFFSDAFTMEEEDFTIHPTTPYSIFHPHENNNKCVAINAHVGYADIKDCNFRGFHTAIIVGKISSISDVYIKECSVGILYSGFATFISNSYISSCRYGIHGIPNQYGYDYDALTSIYLYGCWIDMCESYGIYASTLCGVIDCIFDHINYSAIYSYEVNQKLTISGNISRTGMYYAGATQNDIDKLIANVANATERWSALVQCSAISIAYGNNVVISANVVPGFNEDYAAQANKVCPYCLINSVLMADSTILNCQTELANSPKECKCVFTVAGNIEYVTQVSHSNMNILDCRRTLVKDNGNVRSWATGIETLEYKGVKLTFTPNSNGRIGSIVADSNMSITSGDANKNTVIGNLKSRYEFDQGGMIINTAGETLGTWRMAATNRGVVLHFNKEFTDNVLLFTC